MGHILFLFMHFAAILCGFVFLFLTIPLHIIYAGTRRGSNRAAMEDMPSPKTHMKCPDCRELVLKGASVCKHCGCQLVPAT